MVLDYCILLGLAAPLLLSAVLFLIVQSAVARRRIGPMAATLFYGLCVAALPLPVWWGVIALAEFYMVGDDTSIWASILRVGLAFLMYAYLGVSWALSLVAAGLAAWRFEVCARRAAVDDAAFARGGP
jgi:hypothetical protein